MRRVESSEVQRAFDIAKSQLSISVEQPTLLETDENIKGGGYDPVRDYLRWNPETEPSSRYPDLKLELVHKNQWDSLLGHPDDPTQREICAVYDGFDNLHSMTAGKEDESYVSSVFLEADLRIAYMTSEDPAFVRAALEDSENASQFRSIVKDRFRELPGTHLNNLRHRFADYQGTDTNEWVREVDSFAVLGSEIDFDSFDFLCYDEPDKVKTAATDLVENEKYQGWDPLNDDATERMESIRDSYGFD